MFGVNAFGWPYFGEGPALVIEEPVPEVGGSFTSRRRKRPGKQPSVEVQIQRRAVRGRGGFQVGGAALFRFVNLQRALVVGRGGGVVVGGAAGVVRHAGVVARGGVVVGASARMAKHVRVRTASGGYTVGEMNALVMQLDEMDEDDL